MTVTSGDVPSDIRIRQAERADLLAVYRIEKASFASPWPFEAFERQLSDPGFLVAVEEGGGENGGGVDTANVIGFVVADLVPNHGQPLGHIKDLAVHPEFRGEGVGTTLLRHGLKSLQEQSVSSVKLEVREENDGAQRLYSRFGFQPLRRVPRYYDDGEDAIIMIRQAMK
ncbi:ribosomal protein S18-alanine N-acetyltransferase [Natranaeroarchaeum aerophilus]|uniref:Ribosomal protein S18-alanine N-acetyltransferase n=1 Tax=Natranaeroarchaeum aerophilus TaxID=2917711 RepID=A0AAE3K3Z0_9EURY|nr:ribosomal protein S18-alanine N-acetyltransferase [Natranaeroarchaeum aerophilus]